MFFLGKVPDSISQLIDRLETLNEKLMLGYDGPMTLEKFSHNNHILDIFGPEQLGRIRSGVVTAVSKGVEVVCFEEGDLIGLGRVFGLPVSDLKVDDTVEIELIHRDDFVSFVNSDPMRQHRWSNYLLTMTATYQEVLNHFHVKVQMQTPKGFQRTLNGERILKEGDVADTVYQLMSGSADVTVDGVNVGEILDGEIFGAMAVFTGELRNATVVAREDCQLLAIPKAQFVDLIRAQPETAITLLDNMSRCIKSLNSQVLKSQSKSA